MNLKKKGMNMKKLFTLVALAVASLGAMANDYIDYTDSLEVAVNGVVSTQTATISVTKTDEGQYSLSLKNFMFKSGADVMPVGNITMTNANATEDKATGVVTLTYTGVVPITNGDDPSVSMWIGPTMLKQVPVNMIAEMRGEKLYTVIDIDLTASLQQVVKVVFGNGGYQIANSDFEHFHTAAVGKNNKYTSDEPNSWHSFMSSTGKLSSLVSSTPHTFISNDVRPGSTGTKSVLVTSGIVFGFAANGTITTGRMKAGAMSPADTENCAFLDMTSTDVDGNNDPFYTTLNGTPDSLAVWMKFKQGTIADPANKYATISAAITNGGYYQDPGDSLKSSVVARGGNSTIESNGNVWQRVTLPFDYETYKDNDATVKAILVTISTNAVPGVGSSDKNSPDSLLVDDLSLIYNAKLAKLDVPNFDKDVMEYNIERKGEFSEADIEAVADGHSATVSKAIEATEDGVKATVTVRSGDLRTVNVYTINVKGATLTAINTVEGKADKSVKAIYNLSGQRVDTMRSGEVYIQKLADGTIVKVAKR